MFFTQLGGEAGVSNPQTEKLKTFFRAMSILLIPVTATFPSVSYTLPATISKEWLTSV